MATSTTLEKLRCRYGKRGKEMEKEKVISKIKQLPNSYLAEKLDINIISARRLKETIEQENNKYNKFLNLIELIERM